MAVGSVRGPAGLLALETNWLLSDGYSRQVYSARSRVDGVCTPQIIQLLSLDPVPELGRDCIFNLTLVVMSGRGGPLYS